MGWRDYVRTPTLLDMAAVIMMAKPAADHYAPQVEKYVAEKFEIEGKIHVQMVGGNPATVALWGAAMVVDALLREAMDPLAGWLASKTSPRHGEYTPIHDEDDDAGHWANQGADETPFTNATISTDEDRPNPKQVVSVILQDAALAEEQRLKHISYELTRAFGNGFDMGLEEATPVIYEQNGWCPGFLQRFPNLLLMLALYVGGAATVITAGAPYPLADFGCAVVYPDENDYNACSIRWQGRVNIVVPFQVFAGWMLLLNARNLIQLITANTQVTFCVSDGAPRDTFVDVLRKLNGFPMRLFFTDTTKVLKATEPRVEKSDGAAVCIQIN